MNKLKFLTIVTFILGIGSTNPIQPRSDSADDISTYSSSTEVHSVTDAMTVYNSLSIIWEWFSKTTCSAPDPTEASDLGSEIDAEGDCLSRNNSADQAEASDLGSEIEPEGDCPLGHMVRCECEEDSDVDSNKSMPSYQDLWEVISQTGQTVCSRLEHFTTQS